VCGRAAGNIPRRQKQTDQAKSEMKPEIVQTQSWCYKTVAIIKRQQQTTMSINNCCSQSLILLHTKTEKATQLILKPSVRLGRKSNEVQQIINNVNSLFYALQSSEVTKNLLPSKHWHVVDHRLLSSCNSFEDRSCSII